MICPICRSYVRRWTEDETVKYLCIGCQNKWVEGGMKIAELVRLEKSDQGLIGVLRFDGVVFCMTLEPDTTFLKQGSYHCQRFHGEKWTDTFEIEVPGHTAVLFHAGNVEADSKGCVLLGSTVGKLKGDRAVLNSGDTFKRFLEVTKDQEFFTLFVTNYY